MIDFKNEEDDDQKSGQEFFDDLETKNPSMDYYLETADPSSIRFHGLDYACIGTDDKGNLVYCYDRILECFVQQGMHTEEAIEWIDYNVICINGGEGFTILFTNETITELEQ